MALVKVTNDMDKVEIVGQFKHIQLRSSTHVEDDETGEKFGSPQYSRRVISPSDDVANESPEVQALVAAVHTDQIKADYAAFVAAQQAEVAPQEV